MKARREEVGFMPEQNTAKRCLNNVFHYLLYQDTTSLFESLEYHRYPGLPMRSLGRYFVFRHMLRLIKNRHPQQLNKLCL